MSAVARRMWSLFEPVHAVVYAPAAQPTLEAAGMSGFWRWYFAGRAAPLGAVGPGPVLASFFSFAPSMVNRALPDVWQRVTPEQALAARERASVDAMRAMGAPPDEAGVLLAEAAAAAEHSGRVLGGANAALPVPEEPVARLWYAATVLREHRGDGHIAALVAAGISGREALVLRCGLDLSREVLQPARGWTDDQWEATAAGLVDRGLLDEAGRATASGVELFRDVEDVTDRCASGPWRALGGQATDRLAEMLAPLASASLAVSWLPKLLGIPRQVQGSGTATAPVSPEAPAAP